MVMANNPPTIVATQVAKAMGNTIKGCKKFPYASDSLVNVTVGMAGPQQHLTR
jgi:hypothetical protein